MKRILVVSLAVIGLIFMSVPVQADLDDGLVAYYPFNGNANDESGNGYDGTANGVTLTSDRFGDADSAYDFDGIDNYIEIPYSSDFVVTNKTTISLWIKSSQSFSQLTTLVHLGLGNNNGNDDPFRLNVLDDGSLDFQVEHGSGAVKSVQSTFPLSGNEWYHLVATYDYTLTDKNIKIYINGGMNNSADFNESFSLTSNNLTIGTYKTTIAPYYKNLFSGVIDDVRIYNRALSDSEIQELYNESSDDDTCGDYDTGYQTGYQAGVAYCKNNPSACGISADGGSTDCPTTSTGAIALKSDLSFTVPNMSYQTLIGTFDIEATFEYVGDSNGEIHWRLGDVNVK